MHIGIELLHFFPSIKEKDMLTLYISGRRVCVLVLGIISGTHTDVSLKMSGCQGFVEPKVAHCTS